MNAARMEKFKALLVTYAECNRKVFPIINTCLDNITQSANKVDPVQVLVCACVVCVYSSKHWIFSIWICKLVLLRGIVHIRIECIVLKSPYKDWVQCLYKD